MVDLRPFYLTHSIDEANKGYAESAREVLRLVASCIEDGVELPQETKSYLVKALKDISEGAPSQKALNLNGRKSHTKAKRDIDIATAVYETVKEGKTIEKACEGHCLSYEAVRAIYYKYKEALDEIYNEENY